MEIRIRRQVNGQAILISFDTDGEKFESASERNKFFQTLHGRRQIVIKNNHRYVYERQGLLNEIPHINVAQSAFIVAMENLRQMEEFFSEWEDKVEVKTFPVLVNEKELVMLKKMREQEVE